MNEHRCTISSQLATMPATAPTADDLRALLHDALALRGRMVVPCVGLLSTSERHILIHLLDRLAGSCERGLAGDWHVDAGDAAALASLEQRYNRRLSYRDERLRVFIALWEARGV